MRIVRSAIERPDSITASAVSARDEIGRAVAAKIRETKSVKDLAKVTEEVLPQIEKFLESPEEKRLRRIRNGTVMASIGAGVTITFSLIAIVIKQDPLFFAAGMGLITFLIGLSVIINGFFSSLPRKEISDMALPEYIPAERAPIPNPTNDLSLPEPGTLFSSVTENTTRHLKEGHARER